MEDVTSTMISTLANPDNTLNSIICGAMRLYVFSSGNRRLMKYAAKVAATATATSHVSTRKLKGVHTKIESQVNPASAPGKI